MSISEMHASMLDDIRAQGPKCLHDVRLRPNRGVARAHKARKHAEAVERDKLTPWHRTKRYRRLHDAA